MLVVSFLTGQNPLELLQLVDSTQVSVSPGGGPPAAPSPAGDEASEFVRVILADTEDTWRQLYPTIAEGQAYRLPGLVLFERSFPTACGMGQAAMGPFYCPADSKVYLDLSFFRELSQRFGAPGDFARAYVIAHEVGHHVQNLLGISGEVHRQQQRLRESEGNQLSVRLELQADCLAGVWGRQAAGRGLLETGDVEEGLRAAAAIGDDTLQRGAGAPVRPESWTHGSSDQRVRWFRRGLESGDPNVCETFQTSSL